jgi:hypothetical protein
MFNCKSTGSGYYYVYVNGVQLPGGHDDEPQAIMKAQNAKLDNPSALVYVGRDYKLVIDLEEAPKFVDANVGQILNLKLVASDPSVVSISGLSVTPLKEADVELSVEVA